VKSERLSRRSPVCIFKELLLAAAAGRCWFQARDDFFTGEKVEKSEFPEYLGAGPRRIGKKAEEDGKKKKGNKKAGE
jgi:hypothetical protein